MQLVAQTGRNGSLIASRSGVLFLFDRSAPQPVVGETVEAMITHHRRAKDDALSALVVRPVTADDFLVRHAGFICRRDRRPTSAMIYADDRAMLAREVGVTVKTVTPGRSPVPKSRCYPDGKFNLLRPGRAYIAKSDLLQGWSRICGLPTLDDVDECLFGHPSRMTPNPAALALISLFRSDASLRP
jgi:hypothetical protein